MAVGNNGIILRSQNRGISWFRYTSGTVYNLNRIYMYTSNNITIVGQNGLILTFSLNPYGNLQLYDDQNLLLNNDISANNPTSYLYFNNLLVKNFNLYANFVPYQSDSFGISKSNLIQLTIQPIFYYQPAITDTVYERQNIIYSVFPFVDQSGGIFSILNNTNNLITIDQYNGQITFNTGLNVSNYILQINYLLNSVNKQITYNLIVRPTIYFTNNYLSLVYTISGYTIAPYVNQPNGNFTIIDISGSLVTNNYISINSNTGIIFINNNSPINNYIISVIYTLNSVRNSTSFLLNIRPYISYPNNLTNLDYNTSSNSFNPNVLLPGGYFNIFDISYNLVQTNLVTINNLGIITFNAFINVNFYTFLVTYTYNNVTNTTLYYLNASPYLKYPETSKVIKYDHTIYDASSNPIFIPNNGFFTISDLSGTTVNQNLVTINYYTGQIIFNLLNVGAYLFSINYTFNNAVKNVNYGLLVIPSFYYSTNYIVINYLTISNSILPYTNPNNGSFTIKEVDNILVQLNLVKINYLNGIISFLNGINVSIYNFTVTYSVNNIINVALYNLTIIPNITYTNNRKNLLYTISGFSTSPIVSPPNGLFSILNNSFPIDNNGIITFNNNINVGIYNINVNYTVNNITNSYPYILTIVPIIYYNISAISIQYKTSAYSQQPIVNQQNGSFRINDILSNFVSINSLGIIYFASGIYVGIYNFTIYYTLNNVTNSTIYTLTVNPNISYSIGYYSLLYDRSDVFYTEQPFVDQSGGSFNITDNVGNLVFTNNASIDNNGIIMIYPNIDIQNYVFNIVYTLRNTFINTTYSVTVIPNLYYSISSIIINYNNNFQSIAPYYLQVGGNFTLYDLSNSTIAQKNYAAINQYGIITFNNIINVGLYPLLVNYQINSINNNSLYNYKVIPNLTYRVNKTILLQDQSGNSLVPFYSQLNGQFNIYDFSGNYKIASNSLVFIDTNGMIYFNPGINAGIYYLNVVYTLNYVSNNFIYYLYIIPTLYYADNNKILLYDRSFITYSTSPAFVSGGYYTINDIFGSLVTQGLVLIDINTGIIQFNPYINVGRYSFNIIYNFSGVQNSIIFNLSIIPNLYYTPNIINTYFNVPVVSTIPYYNQKNGTFSIADVIGNLVLTNFIFINPNTGLITFPKAINVGNYQFVITYNLNSVFNQTYYYLTIIPLINYTINLKNVTYGKPDNSIAPIVNQKKGTFSIYDLSNNGVYQTAVTINNTTGIIYFSDYTNVGIYAFTIQYTLNTVSNYAIYYLYVYPTISYTPNYQIILYNRLDIVTSVLPQIQQLGGNFYFYDSSGSNLIGNNSVYADLSGALYFKNQISVGNYSFNILYTLNGLSVLTNYSLQIIPNLTYTNTYNTYLYGTNFTSSIPYYAQTGGLFTYIDISNTLTTFLTTNSLSGTFYTKTYPNVGIYQLKIIYTLNNAFNTAYFVYFILPTIVYKINNTVQAYNTDNFSIQPLVNQPGGIFSITGYNSSGSYNFRGIYIDSSFGIIEFSNFVVVDIYVFTITYGLNYVINTTNYYLTVLPLVQYFNPTLIAAYENSASSAAAIIDPPDGTFSILPNITDISNYNNVLLDISYGLISIDPNVGIINFANNIFVGNYYLTIYYTYNTIANVFNFKFIKQPTIKFDPNYTQVNYHDISFSYAPVVAPRGGTFTASLPLINLIYTGISIDRNTGILRFGLVNAGTWNLTVTYNYNGVTKSYPYTLEVISIIHWNPAYSVVGYNTSTKTKPAISQIPNGQYTSTATIPGFSIDSITGVLTFNYIDTGVYFIPITYTFFGTSVVNSYILVVQPFLLYSPSYLNTTYTIPASSLTPAIAPLGGSFSATFNDEYLSPLYSTINQDSISGIISVTGSLLVGVYSILANYTFNGSSDSKVFTITVYPEFIYNIGNLNMLYGTINYSERPLVNPGRGVFKTNSTFYIDMSSGIIEFKNTTPVGIYYIPITYTYRLLTVNQTYNLTVNPVYYYSINKVNIIIKNSVKSVYPYAKQEGGKFNFISLSGTTLIPYSITYLNIDQYNPFGIILNGYTGVLYFGDKILVGSYNILLSYSLYGLTTNTTYSITVQPYFNYSLTNLVIDYNTPAISSIPVVDQSGGFFYFTNVADLNTEFNKIVINNTNGIINFNAGIKVSTFNINITYTVAQVSNYILYTLTIRPIFYYLINNASINVDTTFSSIAPTVVQTGGSFIIVDYDGLTSYNIQINITTGILFFRNIDVGIYTFILQYTLNGSSITTTYNLTVKPSITYDINLLTLFYSFSGYSDFPYTPYAGGLFGFEDIGALNFMTTKINIDISTGQIFFGQYINTGTYNIVINYNYNGIKNTTNYTLVIQPLIEYTISGDVLDYNHNIYSSIIPTVFPLKGLFYFADNSNNYPIKEIILNKKSGQINITKLAVGNYNIGIKYYVKEFCSANKYIISILSTFYYPNNNSTSVNYQNTLTYTNSLAPFTDPSGGQFDIVYPLDGNLLGNMSIDNNTGILTFGNFIEINSYYFNVSYTYNLNQTFVNYNLIVVPLFYYLESLNRIFYGSTTTSSIPNIYPYGGIFTIRKINITTQTNIITVSGYLYNSISIDQYVGVISINNILIVGDYLLTVTYTYNNINAYFNYLFQILPITVYDISNQIIVYGYKNVSIKPNTSNNNGLFSLDPVYNNNGIFIDASSGILNFASNINIGFYPINISYTLIDINQILMYYLTIVPDIYYDSSNILINYKQIYYSKIPFVNPPNGIFTINIGSIDNSGVFMINNLNVNTYNLIIKYNYRYYQNSYYIKLIIQSLFYYPTNFQNNIYNQANNSSYPYVNPPNGIYYLDVSNLTINNGLITFNPSQMIGKYKLNVYYKLNNIITTTNYYYYILPYLKYNESIKQIVGGTSITSSIPQINPQGGKFYINYKNIYIDSSGIIYFNSNIIVNVYNLIISYAFSDLSSNFNYKLTVTPYIYYNNKVINYGTFAKSELPINNSSGGIFNLSFNINTFINLSLINIDISSGIITFYSGLDVNSYFFNVNYTINNLSYTHIYNLLINPVLVYNDINIIYQSSITQLPVIINPPGGTFTSNNLPSFIYLNINTGAISTINANQIGNFNLNITYTFNNVSINRVVIFNVTPKLSYNYNIINYLDRGSSDIPITSISGGIFISNNLPFGLSINRNNGNFNYYDNITVNNYYINVYYLINDVSGFNIFRLTVKPYFNYITGISINYGSTGASVVPITQPSGGYFYLPNNFNGVRIDYTYGILTVDQTVVVGQYYIPLVYVYNDISSNYIFNLKMNQKIIYADFVANDKIYDATTKVQILSNKLFGVINDDKVYIDTYSANFQTIGPGYNIPLFVYNLSMGGPDSYNYIIQYDNMAAGNIYLFKYDPNNYKVNQGTKGKSNNPILAFNFTNPSFLLSNITVSSLITISNIVDITIDPFGIINWEASLNIGIYYLNIYGYTSTVNSYYNYTLEVTENLYEGAFRIAPPAIPNTNITSSVAQLQYSSTTGSAYALNNNINGLVGQVSINAYNASSSNLTHDLGAPYPFTFQLPNADPSANLFTYELNDDGTVNYSVGYKLVYVGGGYWTGLLTYLSDFYIQDLLALANKPPTFDPPAGTYYASGTIDIYINALPNSIVFYTVDGTTPTVNSLTYNGPISIIKNTIIQAFAVTPGHKNSDIAIASYIVHEVPCILSKTLIRTPYGNELIDNLNEGDYIITGDNRIVPIVKILKYTINKPNKKSYPVCIPKDFFSKNIPDHDTYLSQNHAIKLEGNNWIYGGHHLNYFNLDEISPLYYHIMLPNYYTDDLIANNMIVESWSGMLPSNANIRYVVTGNYNYNFNNKNYVVYKKIRIDNYLMYKKL
jgi:hypothetical protein